MSSVVKWAQRARSTGSPAPRRVGGSRGFKLDSERDWLLGRLVEMPNLTLHALPAELRERHAKVSCDTLWRFLRAAGISLKKTVFAGEQDRPDAARWRKYQGRINPRRLVFIDETQGKTIMARTHGWNKRGTPLMAKVPHGHWKTLV